MRIVLIDNNSGYIFGDSADLDGRIFGWDDVATDVPQSPTEDDFALSFAKALDRSIGEVGRAYHMTSIDPQTDETGYYVYRVDVGGSHVIGDVHDGQDHEIIDAVTTRGQWIGFITATNA